MTSNRQAIIDVTRAMTVATSVGNFEPSPSIFPDQFAPVVRNVSGGRELTIMRWGMPSPAIALKNRKTDTGVTNVRNTKSLHWRRWLGPKHRCVVPVTSFCEYDTRPGKGKEPVWFALDETRPLAFFAGIWTEWTSVRKLAEGETTNNLFGFLTTDANEIVRGIHPKAMPVILNTQAQVDAWMTEPTEAALRLQVPFPDDSLEIVARGQRADARC